MDGYREVRSSLANMLFICDMCGSVVADTWSEETGFSDIQLHDKFHEFLANLAQGVGRANMFTQPLGGSNV